jgi:hypothetical protein
MCVVEACGCALWRRVDVRCGGVGICVVVSDIRPRDAAGGGAELENKRRS